MMHRYIRSPLCSSFSPFSLLNRGMVELKWSGFIGLRLLQTLTSSHGASCLPYNKRWTNGCMEVEIVNALRLGQRKRASNLLLDLALKSRSVKVENFSYILRFCAKSPDPLFAIETWKIMEDNTVEVNEQCWIYIIQALSSGGYLKEAYNLLVSLGETDRSTLQMYNLYLSGCVQSKNIVQANSCLQLMENHYIGMSRVTYFLLLKVAVQQRNKFLAHNIWDEFNKYYELSFASLQKFIWSFSMLRDFESACSALKQMVSLTFQGNASTNVSSSRRYNLWLDIPILPKREKALNLSNAKDERCILISKIEENTIKIGGDLVEIHENDLNSSSVEKQTFHWNREKYPCNVQSYSNTEDMLTEVHGNNIKKLTDLRNVSHCTVSYTNGTRARKILRSSFNTLLHACGKSGKCFLAEKLFHQMLDLGLELSAEGYDGFIQAVISFRGVQCAIKVFKGMKARNLKPLDTTLASLSIGCSKDLDLELAEAFIDQISDAYPMLICPFNALLSACYALDQLESAVQFFSKMKKKNVQPNIRTYELLFRLFGFINAPYEMGDIVSHEALRKRVRALEMDMFNNGVGHNSFTLEYLIRAFGFEGMTEELLQYLSIAENKFSSNYPGTITYNIVLHALVEAMDCNAAINVFKKMIAHSIPLDAATFNIMIDCCSVLTCLNSANALLSLMIRSGFIPATCTYTTLLKILISGEKFDDALELFDKLLNDELEADILVFNTILQKASEKGHLGITELIIERMHQAKVQPDPTTCCYAFAAYVYDGFYDTAMEALQVLSMRMISEDNSSLQEKRSQYEYLVYSEDCETESWIIKTFSVANENLGAALLNLRWCAISGSHISWSPEDSPWAKRLSGQYAPLRRAY